MTTTIDRNKQIADTIYAQLGGSRFVRMTGARNFSYAGPSLHFGLPARFAKDGINRVVVELNGSDLYDVTFYRFNQRAKEMLKTIAEERDVYADQLRAIFEKHTGLYTSL